LLDKTLFCLTASLSIKKQSFFIGFFANKNEVFITKQGFEEPLKICTSTNLLQAKLVFLGPLFDKT
jgi:hypothetical protein